MSMHLPSLHHAEQNDRLWTFHGGLHLPDNKSQSTVEPLADAALPAQLVVPLQQHIGEAAEPLVQPGDRVLKGQMLASPLGYVCAPVHAPSSGVVSAIEERAVPHPSGLSARCIIIDTDGRDEWAELPPAIEDFASADPAELRERVRWAGIVGMGGAAFPSSVKLNPGPDRHIHTLIINGAECEPYITCDDLLMRHRAADIIDGIRIIRHMLGDPRCLIGVEDNKPEAIAALRVALDEAGLDNVSLRQIPTRYPSGGEKQLIRVLTGEEVPSGGIPADIGFVCHNVATAAAVADAVLRGQPLIERIVTLTGEGIVQPRNLRVRIGTLAAELVSQAGGYTAAAQQLILGGPMMGFNLAHDEVPITKGANCLLVPSAAEVPDPGPASACIRCGQCAAACPVELLPQQLYWHARARDLDKVQDYNLFDCIECGCCSHVCPAHIPLVQYYRFAKTELWAKEQEKRKSDLARRRHEARVARLERQEAERKSRLRKKKEDLDKKPAAKGAADPKKAAIEAAMQRAREKKAKLAEQGVTPKNTEELSPAQQKQVDAAEARRAETQSPAAAEEPSESKD